jgi:hypothetical protein
MIRRAVPVILLLCLCLPVFGQNIGDQYTAGFNPARTFANNNLTDFRPPFRLFETIDLEGVTDATSLAVFEDQFLVGQGGAAITYRLFNGAGSVVWTQDLLGAGQPLNYTPSLAGNVVILGSEGTTAIRAVNIATGVPFWSDATGTTAGRMPVVTDNMAIYAGAGKLVARRLDGTVFWQKAATTLTRAAAISVFGNSVYFLDGAGAVRAIDLASATGAEKWATDPDLGDAGTSMIATEKYLFVGDPASGLVGALNTMDGVGVWGASLAGTLSASPALALGNGRLLVFRSDNGSGAARVEARNPADGSVMWAVTEEGPGVKFGFVADKVVYYYHEASSRIRARDVASGVLLWSMRCPNLRALSAFERELVALLPGSIAIYRPEYEAYMAHLANGGGQTTLITLANVGPTPVNASVHFVDSAGLLVAVPVQSVGTVNKVDLTIPANSSASVQTEDTGGPVITGWVRVTSDGLLRGTSIFQYSVDGDIAREAGVSDSLATGSANVFMKVADTYDSGVAIANPTEDDGAVTLRLLDSSGVQVAEQTLTLASGEHVAGFISELFAAEVGNVFDGTLVVDSDVPVVIAALRTKGALQLSSYPVGQVVR